ncbi:adenosylcobinamide-GDP ribazoletransferase [Christensenellaceae bacterium NSJ-44]|uniref:Adenosylcobinamide-GDP ribazoletransferase n=2 Tax=Luoshenia tenuis TaxID=2763654 RepID=A0A926HNG7_9FIRM|nr:adenosylcobinamide-GDP ribazoletransferase [Luoshenia tenuis]
MKTMTRRLIFAFQFMTRLPIRKNLDLQEGDFAGCSVFYPLVGLLTGGVGCLAAWLANFLQLPLLTGFCAVLAMVAVNGALHLDGLADCCDALFSARSREKMLEIMRDSRLGTMGAVGLFADLAAKTLLIAPAATMTYSVYGAILLAPLVGKACIAAMAFLGRSARRDGLGVAVIDHMKGGYLLINLLAALAGVAVWGRSLYWGAAVLAGLALAMLMTLYFHKKLGGITGDCLGAASEIGEIGFLLALRVISVWG